MLTYFSRKLFIALLTVSNISIFAMQDIPGQLPGIDDQPRFLLASTYRDSCQAVNNNESIGTFCNALNNFRDAINFPIPAQLNLNQIVINYNHANFIARGNLTLNRIRAIGNEFLIRNIKIHEEDLSKRLDLARMDENIRLGEGVRSHFNHPNLSVNAQNALRSLTGRIFQISVDQNPELLSTSTGTLAAFNNVGLGIQNQLLSLIPGNNQLLNSILTCAHAYTTDKGRSQYYFVPSNQLDLCSGLPNGMVVVNNDERDIIAYLRNNQNAFRITTLRIQDNNNLLHPFDDIDLTMGQPQYLNNEDCVIASIVANPGGNLLQYGGNSRINFFPNQPILQNMRCFAIGYSGCFHYDLTAFNLHQHAQLINNFGEVSPLFIMSDSLNNIANIPQFNNGEVSCHIPSAEGMSGGAMFYENLINPSLNIFGCITSGYNDNDMGNYFL